MNYSKYVDVRSSAFKVSNKLIEFGGATWQIKNVAATHVEEIRVVLKDPEPVFSESKPGVSINFKAMFISALIVFVVGAIYFGKASAGMVLAFLTLAAFVGTAFAKNSDEVEKWQQRKNEVQRKWDIWNEIRNNPPVIYALTLETNAGSKPLFQSFNKSQMTQANDAIKRAMASDDVVGFNLNIDTINVGSGESINNFGSTIYNQTLAQGG